MPIRYAFRGNEAITVHPSKDSPVNEDFVSIGSSYILFKIDVLDVEEQNLEILEQSARKH